MKCEVNHLGGGGGRRSEGGRVNHSGGGGGRVKESTVRK